MFFQCNFLWSCCYIWCHCCHYLTNQVRERVSISDICTWVSKSRICNFCIWNHSWLCKPCLRVCCLLSYFVFSIKILKFGYFKSRLLPSLIVCSESFLMLCFKAVCGNHWKQLCIIRCPELLPFREDSCNWDLWQCTWVVWSDCWDNYVSSSLLACKERLMVCLLDFEHEMLSSITMGRVTCFSTLELCSLPLW